MAAAPPDINDTVNINSTGKFVTKPVYTTNPSTFVRDYPSILYNLASRIMPHRAHRDREIFVMDVLTPIIMKNATTYKKYIDESGYGGSVKGHETAALKLYKEFYGMESEFGGSRNKKSRKSKKGGRKSKKTRSTKRRRY
jgi:hypothetical protein